MRLTFLQGAEQIAQEWPQLLEMFQRLPWTPQTEYRPEQLRDLADAGRAHLVRIEADDGRLIAAVALEHIDYPAYTAVNILAMAGDRPGRDVWAFTLAAVREFAQRTGATAVQALCGDGIARLLARHGFKKAYNQVRVEV